MKRDFTLIRVLRLMAVSIALAVLGCAAAPPVADLQPTPEEKMDWSALPIPPQKKQLVAVAGFENKSTYSADKLWDTSSSILASYLLRAGYFRVVEWEKMKQLFDWDTLSSASLVKTPENMKKAQRILLCEHFLSGSITCFDVRQHASVSATSKRKVI
ncbi:MAG: CsgG/HfaB family protein, partial [Thermodesulfobacteriota bacterium]|nr:CsgG/HfaB family protein [Thermodesulfobacteriota bacterium]